MRFNTCGVTCSLMFAVLLVSPSQTFGDLVAHWSFDADYTEDTGTRNGTLVDTNGNSGLDTTVKQFGVGSLHLSNDQSDYVDIPNSITLRHDTNGYSISFWAKKHSNNNNSMALGNRLVGPSYIWLHKQNNIIFRTGTDTHNTTSKYALTSDTGWHHIVIVNDGTQSNNMTFYVDNMFATLAYGGGTHTADFIVNTIGDAWHETTRWAYHGHIDEVWIFDHAIEQNIVDTLFESNSIPEPSCIGLLTIGGIIAITWRHRPRWGNPRQ